MVYWDTDSGYDEGSEMAVKAAADHQYNVDDICDAFVQVGIIAIGCGITRAPCLSPLPDPPGRAIPSSRPR